MIQRQSYNLCGVTDTEYRNYCKERGLNIKHESSKKEFYYKILTGRLIRSSRTGRLEKHRVIKGMNLEW